MTVYRKQKPVKKLIIPAKRNITHTMYTGTADFNRMLVSYQQIMEYQRNSEGKAIASQHFNQLAMEWSAHDGEIPSSSTSPYPARQIYSMAAYNHHLIVEGKVNDLVTAFDNIVLRQSTRPNIKSAVCASTN